MWHWHPGESPGEVRRSSEREPAGGERKQETNELTMQ